MKRDHEQTPDWICVGEGPVGSRRWSYACGYCMVRLRAAFEAGEMEDVEPRSHYDDILASLTNEEEHRGHPTTR